MNENSTNLQHRINALEERNARLSAAALRINASLDVDKVLQEVIDNARVLTGAHYGIITTMDVAGQIEEYVTSGLTRHEKDQMAAWPEGPRLFENLRDIDAPLRVSDFRDYVGALGFATELINVQSFQAMPLYHREERVACVFLAGKEDDQEFTAADEDVLSLFAAQAATAIANARTHRNEQRARADLQTLIETSPVGVVVFDGNTGQPVSFNREARRIVEKLGTLGRPPEELLNSITCRRADGRDVSLAEFPISRQLSSNPETVYAEEIMLSVPDGRNVTLLCNSTPVRSADGAVESLIVILQDLAPLEEVTRLRAEFLSKVSDELRNPLIAIKGSSASVLGTTPRLEPDEMLQYFRVIDDRADQMRELIADLLDYGRIATGTLELNPVTTDVATVIEQGCEGFRREFKDSSIDLSLTPNLPRVQADPTRIEQIVGILLRIVARSSERHHAVEFTTALEDVHVAVRLTARHWHIPVGRLSHLFQRYSLPLSNDAEIDSDHAGIDLAICRGLVEAHGGRIWAESHSTTEGVQITFTLPLANGVATAGQSTPISQARSPLSTGPSAIAQVLVINASLHMQRYIGESLTTPDFETLFVADDDHLLDKFDSFNPTLVLLDLQQHSTALHEKIAQISGMTDVPLIFIAPHGMDEAVVKALNAGAVDYIVNPFSRSELVARARGALRRDSLPTPFALNELQIEYEQRKVSVGERAVELTATEYELLRVLSVNAGRVMSYNMLLRQVWGKRNLTPDDPKAVRAVIKRLRNKLGDDAASPSYVLNERGVGYFIPRPSDS